MYQVNISSLRGSSPHKEQLFFSESYSVARVSVVNGTRKTSSPLKVNVTVENTGKSFLLEGQVSVALRLTCSRCLEDFDYFFEGTCREEYFAEKNLPSDRADIKDVQILSPTQEIINIQPAIEEAIILGMPVKVLCSNECRGLCPICGTNLNEGSCSCQNEEVDPRLSKLKELKDRMKDS